MASKQSQPISRPSTAMLLLSGGIGGFVAGIVAGLLIQFGFDPSILGEDIPATVGTSGLAIGWLLVLLFGILAGLVYAGLIEVGSLASLAAVPNTGAGLGLAYGIGLWILYVVGQSGLAGVPGVGDYPLTTGTLLTFALVGVLIGLIYGTASYISG